MSNGDLDLNQVSLPDLVNQHINNAADLLMVSSRLLPGDRIDLFFALAANRPEVAFHSFMAILETNADPTYRALALRGVGRIQDEAMLGKIRACESEDAQELVQFFAAELKGKGAHSNDLTRWAAADAMVNIEYSAYTLQMTELGGIGEPPQRIAKEIVGSYLAKGERLKRFDSQNEPTAEYERYLDFWTFGPAERLFQEKKLDTGDQKRIMEDLSFLGLEIILRTKKAGYSAAKQKISDCFLRYPEDSLSSPRGQLKRFLGQSISESKVDQTILKMKEVSRENFTHPSYTRASQNSPDNQTEMQLSDVSLALKKDIAANRKSLEDLLVCVHQELLEDLVEERFSQRISFLESELKSYELSLGKLQNLKRHRVSSEYIHQYDTDDLNCNRWHSATSRRRIDQRVQNAEKLIVALETIEPVQIKGGSNVLELRTSDAFFKEKKNEGFISSSDSLKNLKKLTAEYALEEDIRTSTSSLEKETVNSLSKAEIHFSSYVENTHRSLDNVQVNLAKEIESFFSKREKQFRNAIFEDESQTLGFSAKQDAFFIREAFSMGGFLKCTFQFLAFLVCAAFSSLLFAVPVLLVLVFALLVTAAFTPDIASWMGRMGWGGLYNISFVLCFICFALGVSIAMYQDFSKKLHERAHELKKGKATLLYTHGKEKNSSMKESLDPLLKDLSHVR